MTQTENNKMAELMAQFEEPTLEKGQLIEGRVLQVDDRDVFVDIGSKSEGVIPLTEFSQPPAIDSIVSAVVKAPSSPNSPVLLSKTEAEDRISWDYLQQAASDNVPLFGQVEKATQGGFLVRVNWNSSLGKETPFTGGKSLFLPLSQLGRTSHKRKDLPGKSLSFRIIELQEKNQSAVVSHKIIQDEQSTQKWEEFLTKHKPEEVVKAKITKIVMFGMFAAIDDVEGLIHSSDISWRKNPKFAKMYAVDQEVDVKILDIDAENNRVSLGIKQLTQDPWELAKVALREGQTIGGTIRSVTRFGAFMELTGYEGVEGLIHRSELSWSKKQVDPASVLKKGQTAEAQILGLDFEKNRIALGLKQILPNPWDSITDIVKVGEVRKGVISSVTKFGAFVNIAPDIDGLIHVSDVSWDSNQVNPKNAFKKGSEVEFKVLEINQEEHRISCGIKQLSENPWKTLAREFPPKTIVKGTVVKVIPQGIIVKFNEKFEGMVPFGRPRPGEVINVDEMKEKHPEGSEINAAIVKIIPNQRKVVLSTRDYEYLQEKKEMKPYLSDGKPATYNPFAQLQDKF